MGLASVNWFLDALSMTSTAPMPAPMWGVTGQPQEATVWRYPRAFPQYRVHHLLRAAGVEAAVARLGGLAVAGAAYHGVGIPACIAGGRAAAHTLL